MFKFRQELEALGDGAFKGIQFIVVSLKEGLFTNANVLFWTRFRDGTSVVERTVSRSTSSLYNTDERANPSSSSRANKSSNC
ncbi:Structural maintenance of chromosomes protein 2 [Puccinia graminis f. sp. tritici]|uniref:Structural maintenance of chromosomes protein 2 n=1 Tax=Puccinia graminis f. sp. tritici TaxID=56615 RepID=A0A5B0RV18_PUCGR|nr:Structural maintenance of chromosomes protein 2 [Puccinia graminis f. sp. tritici]